MADTKIYAGKEGIQELWRRIKSEIGKFTAFQKAAPAGDDRHPDIEDKKTNIIYLVPVEAPDPDHYMEWIWTQPDTGDGSWVCIGDTTTDLSEYVAVHPQNFTDEQKLIARTNIGAFTNEYADIEGIVTDTTLTVDLANTKYSRFSVDSNITDLVINIAEDGPQSVGWFMFEFTLPEDTVLERIKVLDSLGNDCLKFDPMRLPGNVTYQGTVTNGIATVIGYPTTFANPPEWTIRVKLAQGAILAPSRGEAIQIDTTENIWDLTYESPDWSNLFYMNEDLIEVITSNSYAVNNMGSIFYECPNLRSVLHLDTSGVENFGSMFTGCKSLTEICDLDTSRATNMSSMFNGCRRLQSVPEIDTSRVSVLSYMFSDCTSLTSITVNIENAIDLHGMFNNCRNLAELTLIREHQGMPVITDTREMFSGCGELTVQPVVDTRYVKNLSGMFQYCSKLTSITLDTESAEDMSALFRGCSSLAEINLTSTANCKYFGYMFANCTSIAEFPSIDTSNAVDTSGMFSSCSNTEFPVIDTSNVVNMSEMFYGCSNLQNAPNIDTSRCENFDRMFDGCSSLQEAPDYHFKNGQSFVSTFSGCIALTEIPTYDLSLATDVSTMFFGCTNVENGALDLYKSLYTRDIAHENTFSMCGYNTENGRYELGLIHISWGGELEIDPYTIRLVFTDGYTPTFSTGTAVQVSSNCWDLRIGSDYWYNILQNQTELTDILAANIPNVKNLERAFSGCSKLKSVSNFFTSSDLTNMYGTFDGCSSLKRLPKFDTSMVGDFRYTFYNSGLEELPELDYSHATSMYWTFSYTKIEEVTSLNIKNVYNPTYVFAYCNNLKNAVIEDMSESYNAEGMFAYCPELLTVTLRNTNSLGQINNTFNDDAKLTTVLIEDVSKLYTADYAFYRCSKLTSVNFTNLPTVTSTQHMFEGCSSLEEIDLTIPKVGNLWQMFKDCTSLQTAILRNLASATTLNNTFRDCSSLKTVSIDCPNVYNMDQTFYGCSGLTAMPVLSSTEKFIYMQDTFRDCTGIQSGAYDMYVRLSTQQNPPSNHSNTFTNCGDPSVSAAMKDLDKIPTTWGGNFAPWLLLEFTEGITPSFSSGTATQVSASPNVWKLKTPNTTSWSSLLNGQSELISVLDSDSTGITTMSYMFSGCNKLKTVVKLDTSSVKSTYYMFSACSALETVPSFDLSQATSIYYMFTDCGKLAIEVNIDAPNAENCNGMFYRTGITEIVSLNLPKATSLNGMFWNCTSLTKVGNLYCPKANNIAYMFYYCTALVTVGDLYFPTTDNLTAYYMFYNCTSLKSVGRLIIPSATSTYNMFYYCSALEQVPYIDIGRSYVTCYNMFYECRKVKSGAYEAYHKLSVRSNDHSDTFHNCGVDTDTGIEDLNKIPFDWGGYNGAPYFICEYKEGTSPATNSSYVIKTQISTSPNIWKLQLTNNWASSIFYYDFNLLRVIEADTLKLTSMSSQFQNAINLKSVCKLDTRNCQNFDYMFCGCRSLSSMEEFDVSLSSSARNMLDGCVNLPGLAITMYRKLNQRGSYLINYTNAVSACGINTEGGAADLAQIPTEWGGIKPYQTATIGGREYRVIQVGNQLWMAENLDWKYPGITIGSTSSSYTTKYANYYKNDEATYGINGYKYGLLYNYVAAASISENGWHLPTKAEWETLFSNIGSDLSAVSKIIRLRGDNLSSIPNNWYDDTGLRLIPSGYAGPNTPKSYYSSLIDQSDSGTGYYWTATKYESNPNYQSYYLRTSYNVAFESSNGSNCQYSVRLVKTI